VPPTPESHRASTLASSLRALPVEIATIEIEIGAVRLPSYGPEPRPTSAVSLRSGDRVGRGEHVGWSLTAHEAFRKRALALEASRARTVGAFSATLRRQLADPYDRAALEAAAIDLALAQADASLASLIGVTPRPTRYVVSFSSGADPVATLDHALGETELGAKIDVDPAWPTGTFEALAATDRVAILDWKRTGTPSQLEAAHRTLPGALLEDPGPEPCLGTPAVASRRSVDGPFTHARSLDDFPPPVAANVKPARMGGVLEALDGAARCAARGIRIYFGGMFELEVGRSQLLSLAALLAPDEPNDIAPISRADRPGPRPSRLEPPPGPGYG